MNIAFYSTNEVFAGEEKLKEKDRYQTVYAKYVFLTTLIAEVYHFFSTSGNAKNFPITFNIASLFLKIHKYLRF